MISRQDARHKEKTIFETLRRKRVAQNGVKHGLTETSGAKTRSPTPKMPSHQCGAGETPAYFEAQTTMVPRTKFCTKCYILDAPPKFVARTVCHPAWRMILTGLPNTRRVSRPLRGRTFCRFLLRAATPCVARGLVGQAVGLVIALELASGPAEAITFDDRALDPHSACGVPPWTNPVIRQCRDRQPSHVAYTRGCHARHLRREPQTLPSHHGPAIAKGRLAHALPEPGAKDVLRERIPTTNAGLRKATGHLLLVEAEPRRLWIQRQAQKGKAAITTHRL